MHYRKIIFFLFLALITSPLWAEDSTDITTKANPINQLLKGISGFKVSAIQDELLPPDQAFMFSANIKDPHTLRVSWLIAPGYYLYREKLKLELVGTGNTKLDAYNIPRGKPKKDEAFGQVEIFYKGVNLNIPLVRSTTTAQTITLQAKFQGCADRGVCYPPIIKKLDLSLPVATQLSTVSSANTAVSSELSEQDQIAQSLRQDSLWGILLSFFGFGVLLSLTPCIFPMIPILSGLIVGRGKEISSARGFMMSLSYVLASATTYTVLGVLAALFGSNLQSTFQQPWIIVAFSAIFVALSLSMFGFYHLEVPKSIQAKLHTSSEKHRDGSLFGAAVMGSLSSLIVGPCVAAPLAGALIYIGQTGNAILGGSALFAMGLGMGVPLLIIGVSAGKLLPKAGNWLNATKAIFGVLMLGVAVWMLSRILPAEIPMLLWSALLIVPATYLHATDPLPAISSGWCKLWKGVGIIMLAYGLLLLVGFSLGNSNPLKPLQSLALNSTQSKEQGLVFDKISSIADLQQRLQQASANKQTIMLDFYADWCISCKEMEAYTFTDANVKAALKNFVLLQADVTNNTADDKALLAKFNLVGPPGVLFFGTDQHEQKALRVIGYQKADQFLKTLQRVSS
jgi:thioredoxin:protein disulfide reductase